MAKWAIELSLGFESKWAALCQIKIKIHTSNVITYICQT